MEQNFQTSFIPKKPMIEERIVVARPISFLTIASVFILLSILLITGGLYFYKGVIIRNITKMENDLNLAKSRFEPSKITELQELDRRLSSSSEILSEHISITPIFLALQEITMKTVRYTDFSYILGTEQNKNITVKLKGQATGYSAVALQSDLFTENEHLIDPVFSSLVLNEKGDVLFDLEFLVDPSFVDYKVRLLTENTNESIEIESENLPEDVPATPIPSTNPTIPGIPIPSS